MGRRLWAFLLPLTAGSDAEWAMMLVGTGAEPSGSVVTGSAVPAITTPGLDSDLGMWRPPALVTESGRGKVPMPLSRVRIWQPEPRGTGRGA